MTRRLVGRLLPAQSEERRAVLDSPRTQAAVLCRDSLESTDAM